jgi:hypothetical protein
MPRIRWNVAPLQALSYLYLKEAFKHGSVAWIHYERMSQDIAKRSKAGGPIITMRFLAVEVLEHPQDSTSRTGTIGDVWGRQGSPQWIGRRMRYKRVEAGRH